MGKVFKKNILHYTTGLSKYRGGGLTKYVDDLTDYQSNTNNIYILYPGKICLFSKKIKIKKEKRINNKSIYSITNPLPLTLTFGLKSKNYLNKHSNINIWKSFLLKNKIDLVHIHTMMGLYEEFINAAVELKIPIVYSTHDFFGLCSKESFIFEGSICKNMISCKDCPKCNENAFSKNKQILIHSKTFCRLRKTKIFKILKIKEKKKIEIINENKKINNIWTSDDYVILRKKMISMFKKINVFHFNSSISKKIFSIFINDINGEIINITHKDILDNRKKRKFISKKLRITYLGPTTQIKGFNEIIDTIDNVYINNKNIQLCIYSYTDIERDYLIKKGTSYKYKDLKEIMNNTDLIITNSQCYETFGFVAEEALSYAIPVIVSNTMGVKDIVKDEKTGFILQNRNLRDTLIYILNNRECLEKMNSNILKEDFYSFEKHCEDIYNLYLKASN